LLLCHDSVGSSWTILVTSNAKKERALPYESTQYCNTINKISQSLSLSLLFFLVLSHSDVKTAKGNLTVPFPVVSVNGQRKKECDSKRHAHPPMVAMTPSRSRRFVVSISVRSGTNVREFDALDAASAGLVM
jgi:hypothetical protein